MITALSWVPKEASKAIANAIEPLSKEKINELIQNDKRILNDMDEEEVIEDDIHQDEIDHAKFVAKSFRKSCKGASSSSTLTDADDVVNFLKELDMDNYDEEDDDEVELFSSGMGDLYYPSNDMDPYLKNNTEDNYDSDEHDDITIKPTDSLIICTRVDEKVSYLDVYINEELEDGTQHFYFRNCIMIPEDPLCIEWLDCPLKGGEKGNFVAIGSMESSTNIWDLDLVLGGDELLQPSVQLGKIAGQVTSDCHTNSVLGLAWNKEFRNIIASASADKRVKVWDVATQQCKLTMKHHKKKVKAVAWNHYVPQVLLSGSSDQTTVLKDGRDPSHSGLKWSTQAKVENIAWDPHSEHCFVASLKDGTVKGFDIRASSLSPSFTLNAHDDEVSSISYNTYAPNLLATGSEDGNVKLWDLSNNEPSWIATHNPNTGEVFSVSFSEDCPFLLAICGLEGGLKVWDTLSDTGVSRRCGSNRP